MKSKENGMKRKLGIWGVGEAQTRNIDPCVQDIELVTPSRDEEELIVRRESFIEGTHTKYSLYMNNEY